MADDPPTPELVKPERWPPKPSGAIPDFSRTQAVSLLGQDWRFWVWAKNEFSRVSLLAIGSLLLSFGGYIWHVETHFAQIESDIRNVNTSMPKGDNGISALAHDFYDSQKLVAKLDERTLAQERHIDSNDEKLDDILEVFDPEAVKKLHPFSKRNRK